MNRSTLEAKHLATLSNFSTQKDEVDYLLDVVNVIDAYTSEETSSQTSQIGMNGFLTIKNQHNKGELYNEYMNIVENTQLIKPDIINTYICQDCNNAMLMLTNESCMICEKCGKIESYFESGAQSMSYDQEINSDVNISFAYKRINHFNELLAQFQAKESTNIPQEVIEQLKDEFKKSRVKSKTDINQTKVKQFLKKTKNNKYYEHVPHITNILNGIKPTIMSLEIEETLRSMFRDIQEPFEKNKPKDRSNFLSYNYCLYKFCELLGHDEFLNCFQLLKSREKLHQQDVIWRSICKDMNWQYIATV